MDKNIVAIEFRRIRNIFLIIFFILVICAVAFISFKINTETKTALREAKNVKLAFDMLTVEYYGRGKYIYDPTKPGGMAQSVYERICEISDTTPYIRITGYDIKKREVTEFVYENNGYRVMYYEDGDVGERWSIDKIVHLADF